MNELFPLLESGIGLADGKGERTPSLPREMSQPLEMVRWLEAAGSEEDGFPSQEFRARWWPGQALEE